MPFQEESAVARAVSPIYGKYHTTFRSQTGQVHAHLFEKQGKLIAHVAFAPGVKPGYSTDAYYTDLQQYAHEHGYADRLRLIYADQ